MRRLLVMLFVFSLSAVAAAYGRGPRVFVAGFYGLTSISPDDINNNLKASGTTPPLNGLSTSTNYGGSVGFWWSRWDLDISYDMIDAKNPNDITSPAAVSGAGGELMENLIWADLDYHLMSSRGATLYVGAGAGLPTYAHVKTTLSTVSDYDGDKNVAARGKFGLDIHLGQHFGVYFEGTYTYSRITNLKTSSGTYLTNATDGGRSVADLSGLGGNAGVMITF